MTSEAKIIVNLSRENVVCERTTVASTALRRMRGLLGRRSLPSGEGMLLYPAPSIHTAFMRFPIDAVFLDRTLCAVKVETDLPPWRMASARHSRVVLELPAGEAKRRGLTVGDQLGVIAVGDRPFLAETDSDAIDGGSPQATGPVVVDELQVHGETATAARATDPGAPRVLIVSPDRRFRSVAATLLVRRGCGVTVADRDDDLAALAAREGADVVLLDAGARMIVAAREAAAIHDADQSLGVVVVTEEDHGRQLSSAAVLPKWDSFTGLFEAIESARPAGVMGSRADASG